MKYITFDDELQLPVLELTQRNIETLREKLDMPDSARTLIDGGGQIAVRAVPDDAHYLAEARDPGLVLHKDGTVT